MNIATASVFLKLAIVRFYFKAGQILRQTGESFILECVPASFDLDAYLDRIGYRGSHAATLDTLEAVHALHPAAIPFENLNPLLGWPVPLDVDSLHVKMVLGGRGGWCFEHNTLFRQVLESLGFSVSSLAARVLWNAPESPVGPRSHMLLLVDLAGLRYIVDVGFGGNVLTAPLRLEPHIAQSTPHEPHRLLPLENGFVLEASLRGEWSPLYRFTLEPQFQSDYEVSNWYLCHHPSSFFRYMLLGARVKPEARYALRNNTLTIHGKSETEKRTLPNAAALRACLEMDLGLQLPQSAELDLALERLIESPGV
ncbi:MAG: arylamine N-acetyltransferase family protein [Bryobacteraceae bacterium]